MKNTFRIVAMVTVMQAGSAFAANGAEGGGMGLIGWIFIGFTALVVACQFIPAVFMFGSMMMGVFGRAKDYGDAMVNGESRNS